MVTAKDLSSLIRRIEGLKYRLLHVKDSNIRLFSESECLQYKQSLEEAMRASNNRTVGRTRSLTRPAITKCSVLTSLMNDILTAESELRKIIESKIELINKRLKMLGE